MHVHLCVHVRACEKIEENIFWLFSPSVNNPNDRSYCGVIAPAPDTFFEKEILHSLKSASGVVFATNVHEYESKQMKEKLRSIQKQPGRLKNLVQ